MTDANRANVAENASPEVWRAIDQAHRKGATDSPPRTYTRDDLVRAIVGQQWAVAIACWQGGMLSLRLADLPCAVDVVEEMEKT